MPHRPQDWINLILLSFMWGTSFLFTKIALASFSPTVVVSTRLLLGAVVLVAIVVRRGLQIPQGRRIWLHLLVLSLLGNTLPFLLIAWGQRAIDSGLAAMLLAAMPLTTLILAHFFVEGESMSPRKTTGFLVGLSGIAVLVGPSALAELGGDSTQIASQVAIFVAALCYSCNAIIARNLPAGEPVVHTASTITLAAITVLPLNLIDSSVSLPLTFVNATSLLWLGAISTAAATILYFRIIASAGPTFLSLINYLIPPIALIAGGLVLGEQPNSTAILALAITLVGIAISQSSPHRR